MTLFKQGGTLKGSAEASLGDPSLSSVLLGRNSIRDETSGSREIDPLHWLTG